MKTTDLLNDFLSLVEEKAVNKGIWREYPVDLHNFFVNHLKEKPYPGPQTELLHAINQVLWYKLTEEEEMCSEDLREIMEMIVCYGKGSGKDFLISGVIAYVAYILCCLVNPQKFFNFGQDEAIDIINVAVNSNQANEVFFKKLKARLRNCKWFKEQRYRGPELYNEFQITRNKIRFYKNITCHSVHSEAESYEGFNPLVVVFDEFGGFTQENAKKCSDILKSSAITRYNNKYLLIFISYPRSEICPMSMKYNLATTSATKAYWAVKAATWEVNKNTTKEHFKKEYDEDPETADMYYACIPPKRSEGLFQFPERIDEVTINGRYSQCRGFLAEEALTVRELKSGESKQFLGLVLHNLVLNPDYIYFLGGDCGVTGDTYVISLMHGEPTEVTAIENGEYVTKIINKPVEDLILEWRPSKKHRIPVDLLNVADILEQICSMVYVKAALFDKFNSADITQRLINMGVDAEDKSFSNPFQLQIYQNGKSIIYSGNIELLDYVPRDDKRLTPNEELKSLRLLNGNKIDHDSKVGNKIGSKDYSDARMSAIWLVSNSEPEAFKNYADPIILGANVY